MRRTATPQDWVGRMHCLTATSLDDDATDPLGSARHRVIDLAVAVGDLDGLEPRDRAAAFADCPDGPAAHRMARELAGVLPKPGGRARTARPQDAPDAVRSYLDALCAASTAVYYCRRIQHPAGSCWFSVHGPDDDTCGHVLTTVHELGRQPLGA